MSTKLTFSRVAAAIALFTTASSAAVLANSTARGVLRVTLKYLRALFWFYRNGPDAYGRTPFFRDNLHSKIHIYSLALVLHLWNKPHYRNGTFQQDMAKNLRNVAIPGTGVALSFFSGSKVAYMFFLVVLYPLIAIIGAIDARRKTGAKILSTFEKNLMCPEDWFSLWRLNCRMATFHSYRTKNKGYRMEDKWTFLCEAEESGVPVSPSLRAARIVCKHRNEEGGLGYKSFSNAAHGGDWIIQEHLTNNKSKLGAVLPDDAPLSTFRVITAATPLDAEGSQYKTRALSCVFRAGRAGAATDHVCILFNVNRETGKVTHGTTNQHWYQLGAARAAACPWGLYKNEITHHPDSQQPVVGHSFEADIEKILEVSENAHKTLAPGVPIIGWDVALTENQANDGILLLEGNFSCNFFCADFNMEEYLHMLDAHIRNLTHAPFEHAVISSDGSQAKLAASVELPSMRNVDENDNLIDSVESAEVKNNQDDFENVVGESMLMKNQIAHNNIRVSVVAK